MAVCGNWKLLTGKALASVLAGAIFGRAAPAPVKPETEVLNHLNAAVQWHQHAVAGQKWVIEPRDNFFWNRQHTLADEALQSAFAGGRAEASLLALGAPAPAKGADAASEAERIAALQASAASRLTQLSSESADLQHQIAAAPAGDARQVLVAKKEVVDAALNLAQTMQESSAKLSSFLSGVTDENSPGGLQGQVGALQRSVPEVFANGAAGTGTAATTAEPANPVPSSSGLIPRAVEFYTLLSDRRALSKLTAETEQLNKQIDALTSPLRTSMRQIIDQSQKDSEAALSPGETDRHQLDTATGQLEQESAKFKDSAAALVPLRQESILLGEIGDNAKEWRRSLDQEFDSVERVLFGRALAIVVALITVFAISEIWRRATFRYISDPRRRRQFVLIRRFFVGFFMIMVIVVGFISDFSSLATYAGLLTAGIAVALQTIILSMAAYFFLIGRHGVRVGDRVTVSNVTGEVIDIGPVRVHMLELAGSGNDLHPTGRMVIFPNSALFQASPLFREMPGSIYGWHEVTLTFSADVDQQAAEDKIFKAVNEVYLTYRPDLEKRQGAVERMIEAKLDAPSPTTRVRLTADGVEMTVRFPIDFHQAAQIDRKVARRLEELFKTEAALKQALKAGPTIHVAGQP